MSASETNRPTALTLFACQACGKCFSYPRVDCPACHSNDVTTFAASGRATLYSFTIVHRAPDPAWRSEVPYIIAIAATEEGPHLMGRLVNVDPAAVTVGMALCSIEPPAQWLERGMTTVFEPAAAITARC